MVLTTNNFEGWQKAYEKLIKGEDRTVTVKVNTADMGLGSVTNLRYFFPLASSLLRDGKIGNDTPLILKIQLQGSTKEDDRGRLKTFFSQTQHIPGVEIYVDGQKLENIPQQASRIFPLCWVQGGDETSTGNYFGVLNECMYDNNDHWNSASSDGKSYSELANALLKYVRDPERYKGTQDHNFSSEKKKELVRKVNEYLDEQLGHMSILAQIIWLYILRELIEMKDLFSVPEDKGEHPHIHENIMQKSRLDAVSYGESMYQLIENACVHSCGKQAWFGFRMHRAGRNLTMSNLVGQVQTRNMLYENYRNCFVKYDKNGTPYADDNNIFNADYRFYFEFFVLDDAADQLGMIGRYNQMIKSDKDNSRKPVSELEELFKIPVRQAPLEVHVADITVHYGLRLLRRIISVNNGYLIGKTPNVSGETQCYFDGNLVHEPEKEKHVSGPSFMTEWNTVIPIAYKWSEFATDSKVVNGQNCFGSKIEQPRRWIRFLDREELFRGIVKQAKTKDKDIEILRGNLHKCMSGLNKSKLEDSVILIQSDSSVIYELEVFSKALFAEIAEISKRKDASTLLRIALIFAHMDAIYEFVRLFSAFYPDGIQLDMENVQIALCTKNNDMYDVVAMLAGSYLSNTYEYARLFAYHHSENALEYLPLLDYLTMNGGKAENNAEAPVENIALFPFELWLPTEFQSGESELSDFHHSWFVQRMKHILRTNIQDKGYGCMVDDIHIRLGSKIHLNRFFEVELLFHNMGNVVRFAYMIAHELIYGKKSLSRDQRVLLLGYEKYSSMLILQVEYWIKQSEQFGKVYAAVVYDDGDERDVKVHSFFNEGENALGELGSVQVVTILPVGTTLSTIYKIQKVSQRYLGEYFDNQWADQTKNTNFCLILVNHNLSAGGELSEVSARYWSKAERDAQLVTVQSESPDGHEIQVKYFLDADAEWMDPKECPVCRGIGKDIRPIIDGKNSDTMPGAIFSLWGPHAGTFEKLVENRKGNGERISALFGNVLYSHIYDGNNHFQFYMNFKRLYEENQEAIDEDLRNNRVEQNSFHVVVSPQQVKNSTFVKAVIDNAFDGNVRFLHINLTDAYREEVRAKFSYLTEEFRRMRITNPKAKFSFHFVDTSVITGNRLNRARLLIKMLLNQSYVDYNEVQLFDRVFLLVNRCSYDTANYFVREPEKNMYAYIHLAIPSYNTKNDFCPACKLTSKFQLLGKRSSTERLYREFLRLQEKHKKRTYEEYQYWLEGSTESLGLSSTEYNPEQEGTLLTSPAYLGWLKQWLYVNVAEKSKRILSFVPKEAQDRKNRQRTAALEVEYETVKKIKERIEEYAEKSKDWDDDGKILWGQKLDEQQLNERDIYLEKVAKSNLSDVTKFISDEEQKREFLLSVKVIMKTHLIGVRDYMRLKAMQQSYEKLEREKFEENSMSSKRGKYRDVIIDLIGSAIAGKEVEMKNQLKGLTDEEQERFQLTYNVEWLISYIKVLSRAQIVNYYEYRQAITGIMSDMLRILSGKDKYLNYLKKLEKKSKDSVAQNWEAIIKLLGSIRGYDKFDKEQQLCAKLCYQVNMTLVHHMADLQISSKIDEDSVSSIMRLYSELLDRYFASKPKVPYIDLPSSSKIIIRYLKAAKDATMTTNDDVPCLVLAATSNKLWKQLNSVSRWGNISVEKNLLCTAQYIYLENTRMLYSGMLDMKKMISAEKEVENRRPADSFAQYMRELSKEVESCLRSCYKNLDKEAKKGDLLYQNPLANFCRFWHESAGEAPVGNGKEINPIAYMLRYFMGLENLSEEMGRKQDNDDLPYLYEELCRVLCGITGFQMCYFTYCHAGNYPEIFAQSGYHVELMKSGKLLTPEQMDKVVRFAKDKENELISGISRIIQLEDCDYLVLFIPMIGDIHSSDGFYIVFQSDHREGIFSTDETKFRWVAMRKARDVLFMRQRLQGVLSRDYTALVNYRYDCSYVRPIAKDNEGGLSVMHISDLHIHQDMTEQSGDICERIHNALCGTASEPVKIDLLVISGDIVDSEEANAPRIEQNYRYAEQLLNHIVSTLWKDKSGYLPHDWRRRIIVTTGNHDYASMNQYQAALRGRALTSAMPTDGESGTMSKFAYFIEFLIHYLDAPVDQLLYNDLNEVRFYQKLNLKVLILNCSGSATPRRTNKMGINVKKVERLLERDVWKSRDEKLYSKKGKIYKCEPFRLVIGHFSPQYELSYFLDNYDVLPGWVWEPEKGGTDFRPINRLVKLFQEAAQRELSLRFEKDKVENDVEEVRNKFKKEFGNLNRAMDALMDEKDLSPIPEIDAFFNKLKESADDMVLKSQYKERKEIVDKMKENELYQQIEKYYNWLKSDPKVWSEDISKLLHEVGESICMGEQDKKLFKDFIDGEIKDKDLYLAGHIHAYAEDDKNHILVADKLFDKSRSEIHGHIIQILIEERGDGKYVYHSERFQ